MRTTSAETHPERLRRISFSPYLLLSLAPLFWAGNWIIGRGLHTAVPPMSMTLYRWLFAIVFMLPFALPHLRRDWREVRANWRILIVLGLLGIGSHNALAFLGLNYTTATNGVILNSFIPVMIIAISWIFLHQRLSGLQIIGVIVSLLGVLAILSQGSIERLLAFRLNIGDLFVVGSITIWATYTVCLRWRPPNLHPLTFLFVIACVGVVQMLPLYIGEVALGKLTHWSWQVVLAFAGMGLFSSFMAYVFWTQGVTAVGASVAGLFLHLMPVYGTLLAWLFLDERPEAFHFVGIAMILSGIYITSRRASVPVPAAPE